MSKFKNVSMPMTQTLIEQLMFNNFDLIHCQQNFTMLRTENLRKPAGKSLNICYLINFKNVYFFFIDNTVVEHLPCLGKALRTYHNGDIIVVYPGRYNLDGRVYQLADSVHIIGMGNYSEIVGKELLN